jgi:tetratricopeptide (TPR) repeat protein
LEAAIAELEEALRIQPDLRRAREALVAARTERLAIEKTLAASRRVAEKNPGSAAARYNLGVAYMRQGDTFQAIREFRVAVKLGPERAETHSNLALALYAIGRYREAWETLHASPRAMEQVSPNFLAALRSRMPEPR